jgi:hypothetical protein
MVVPESEIFQANPFASALKRTVNAAGVVPDGTRRGWISLITQSSVDPIPYFGAL